MYRFDSSIAELGGCSLASKAIGNICTEDMANMFVQMGVPTHCYLNKLIETAQWKEVQMENTLDGMMMRV